MNWEDLLTVADFERGFLLEATAGFLNDFLLFFNSL
jgi:hypothetical protein